MNGDNDKKSVVTPKTVIFRHPAAVFKLEKKIKKQAAYIKDCYLENHEEKVLYYALAIKKAAESNKSYVVVNFSQLLIQIFEAILTDPDRWDYKDWSYMTFFNVDEDSGKNDKISNDVKRDILCGMYHNSYLMKYTVPWGYTVTEQDIKAIDEWWDWPNKVKTIEELFTGSRKPPFPFYDVVLAYKELSKGEEKSDDRTKQNHSRKAKNGNI